MKDRFKDNSVRQTALLHTFVQHAAHDLTVVHDNRNVIIYSQDAQSKFLINTFSYFSQTFLKCFKLDIFNLNYNQFFKEVATNINNICTSLINHFAKFNLVLKCFYLVKDKNLQTL